MTTDCPADANAKTAAVRPAGVKSVQPAESLPRWTDQNQFTGRDEPLSPVNGVAFVT